MRFYLQAGGRLGLTGGLQLAAAWSQGVPLVPDTLRFASLSPFLSQIGTLSGLKDQDSGQPLSVPHSRTSGLQGQHYHQPNLTLFCPMPLYRMPCHAQSLRQHLEVAVTPHLVSAD